MDVETIKRKLIGDLGDRLGKYTTSTSTRTAPAVWIGGKVPSTYIATGLEVIITPTAVPTNLTRTHDRATIVEDEIQIRLIEHTSQRSLQDVVSWAIAELGVEKEPVVLEETDTQFHQVVLRVPNRYALKSS